MQRHIFRPVLRGCAFLGVLICVGCGSNKPAPPVPVYPVSGKVTLNGAPVADADITFFNAETDRAAFGHTNERGEYRLSTFAPNDGAVAGKHVVTIVKVEAAEQSSTAPVESADYVPPSTAQPARVPKPKSLIPENYGDRARSNLTADVDPGQRNVIDFDLK